VLVPGLVGRPPDLSPPLGLISCVITFP
jgi:hypothetical protein